MVNPRKTAAKALLKINTEKAYSNLTVNEFFKDNELSAVDKAFATALIYGVLDRKITLDYVLNSFLKAPLKKVSPYTKEVLRTSLFQIMFMDKVPHSAAVDEAVKLIKNSKESRNSGFVNGLLRNILRTGINLPADDSIDSLSIIYSCPADIIESFISDYGLDNTKSILAHSLKPSNITIKVNTLKIELDAFKEAFPFKCTETDVKGCLRIEGGMDIAGNSLYKEGLFFVQDEASQRAVTVLNPAKGSRVLDVCAAPGGKSFAMAVNMENCGEIVSCDLHSHRVDLIRHSAKRMGLGIIKPMINDATIFSPELGMFDYVLCDVPCSGLGVIGRKPEIKYKDISEFYELCEIQTSVLKNSARYLKSGGCLLYSTCTLRKKENEDIVESFLNDNSDFTLEYMHTFMPHIDGTDGFFCAKLIKK